MTSHPPEQVDLSGYFTINDHPMWIGANGGNLSLSALLVLDGGSGFSYPGMSRKHQELLEAYFIVAH